MIKQLYTVAFASLFLSTVPVAAQTLNAAAEFTAPAEAWRTVDPENLMLIDTDYGRIGIEMYPDVAPRHTAQIKTLVRDGFYDGIIFHRVIKGFMNQTGDPTGTGQGDSDLPDLEAEFEFKRDASKVPVKIIHQRTVNPDAPQLGRQGAGFYRGLPISTQPDAQAWGTKDGKIDSSGIHCKGVTSMARTSDPNTGNSQFFLMRTARGQSPEALNTRYSVWGRAVIGFDLVDSIRVGVNGETQGFVPDKMKRVRMANDLPESERPSVKMLKTQGKDYKRFLDTQRNEDGTFLDICDIRLPTQIETP